MHTTNSVNDRLVNNNPFMPDVPFHPDPIFKPPTQPIKQNMKCKQNLQDINPNINFDLGGKLTISGRHHVRNISKTGQIILSRSQRIRETS